MRSRDLWAALVMSLVTAGAVLADPLPSCGPARCDPPGGFVKRIQPAGGWHPYPGGLIHWWDPHCFPRCGAPDDYCRKELPCVCWPPYPPYYIWAAPETGCLPAGRRPCCTTAR